MEWCFGLFESNHIINWKLSIRDKGQAIVLTNVPDQGWAADKGIDRIVGTLEGWILYNIQKNTRRR